MKIIFFIFILLSCSFIAASNSSASAECELLQLETRDSAQTETKDDCCSELCYCNCCNHISVISLIIDQNICVNYSSIIISHSPQYLLDYSSFHWQPPKVTRI